MLVIIIKSWEKVRETKLLSLIHTNFFLAKEKSLEDFVCMSHSSILVPNQPILIQLWGKKEIKDDYNFNWDIIDI